EGCADVRRAPLAPRAGGRDGQLVGLLAGGDVREYKPRAPCRLGAERDQHGSDVLQRDRDPWWVRSELADQLCAGGVDRRYPRVVVEPGQISAQESPGSVGGWLRSRSERDRAAAPQDAVEVRRD